MSETVIGDGFIIEKGEIVPFRHQIGKTYSVTPENNSPVAPAPNPEPDPMRVMVDRDQLQALIAQNQELKADIGTFVSVFDGLQGMFTGKGGLSSIIPVVMKLLNDKNKMNELSAIVPVMNKYTKKPETNE